VEETALLARHDGWAKVTLNRPDRLNSFNSDLHARLADVFAELAEDSSVRAIVLTGNGRGFCAGQDLNDPAMNAAAGPVDVGALVERTYNPLIRRLRSMPKPLICAVNGIAAGAGASLALACDIVLAGRSASFLQAFSRIGLVPDAGSSWIMPRLLGDARARALIMLAEPLPAEKAEAWGLIWRCVEDAELQSEADALAVKMAAMPTAALAMIKQMLTASGHNSLDAQLDLEASNQTKAGFSADFAEGVAAFVGKRAPRFVGK
jgi:2-(1,2-epoxy-1,2-dihydrophenyl)acetyl-CoA isomerase